MKILNLKVAGVFLLWVSVLALVFVYPASNALAKAPVNLWATTTDTPVNKGYGVNSTMSCDFDGDHIKDLAVSSTRTNTDTGKAMIYFGGSSLSASPDVTIAGEGTSNRFGDGLSCGDFNGDGIDDLSAGAVLNSAQAGRNYIFYGRSRAAWAAISNASSADVKITGEVAGDHLGNKSKLVDINGDGKADLLAGAELASGLFGRAYIFWGTTGSITKNASQADAIFNNDSSSTAMGSELEVGNLIGNSTKDVILAIDDWQAAGNDCRVVVFDGTKIANGTINASSADLTITASGASYNNFGYPPRVGDFNGDGINDLAVGSDHLSSGVGNGQMFIFNGGPGLIGTKTVADANQTITGETNLDLFSMAIETPDINNDGIADIVATSYFYLLSGGGKGRMYVFLGGTGLAGKTLASQADYIIDSPSLTSGSFGWWIGTGDINNDGWTEFATGISLTGAYYIYSLSHTAPTVTLGSFASSFDYGATVRISGTAADPDLGNISRVQYSLDSGSWQNATAADGSFNSSNEDFYFDLALLTSGSHSVAVRAVDSENATTALADYKTAIFSVGAAPVAATTTLTILPETGGNKYFGWAEKFLI